MLSMEDILKSSSGIGVNVETVPEHKTYSITKHSEVSRYVEIYLNGKLVLVLDQDNVLICNPYLADNRFYRYNSCDRIVPMSDCIVDECDGKYYIACNGWYPRNVYKYPDRVPVKGILSDRKVCYEEGFVQLLKDNSVIILASRDDRFVKVSYDNVTWADSDEPIATGIWYHCVIGQPEGNRYNLKILGVAMMDTDVIIRGYWKWDDIALKWASSM